MEKFSAETATFLGHDSVVGGVDLDAGGLYAGSNARVCFLDSATSIFATPGDTGAAIALLFGFAEGGFADLGSATRPAPDDPDPAPDDPDPAPDDPDPAPDDPDPAPGGDLRRSVSRALDPPTPLRSATCGSGTARSNATGTLEAFPGGPGGAAPGTCTHWNGHDAAPTKISLLTLSSASATTGYAASARHSPSTMNLNRYVPVGSMHVTACVGPPSTGSFTASSARVCVHPPEGSPTIIASSPPPRHSNVTWWSLTREGRSVVDGSAVLVFPGTAHRKPRLASMASVSRRNLTGSRDAAKSASRLPLPL